MKKAISSRKYIINFTQLYYILKMVTKEEATLNQNNKIKVSHFLAVFKGNIYD